jgi:hypothetical protein
MPSSLVEKEIRTLQARNFNPPSNSKTALVNVRIFDGHHVQEPRTIFTDGDTISFDADDFKSASVVDGQGGILYRVLLTATAMSHLSPISKT